MSDIPQRLAAALADRYVVRPELGGPEGVERFLREIELAARLQHPHILRVFDSGAVNEVAGASVPYFVMPFVEGETLRQRLQREGRLPVEAATTLAAAGQRDSAAQAYSRFLRLWGQGRSGAAGTAGLSVATPVPEFPGLSFYSLHGTAPPRFARANAYTSAISAMMRSVGRYPWLPAFSTRMSTGRGQPCAVWSAAANLKE
jgi:hypothetical protein